jgi:uncharacterized protein
VSALAIGSLREPGLPSTDYYAPNFKVEVEGKELDPESKGDVLEVKVTMDKENLTSFDLSINNWDDRGFDFKYSDTTTFDVGNRVHVQMGYADQLRSMAHGVISTLTPRFAESGPPTLGVTGLDSLFKLRGRKPKDGERKIFTEMADWEIAQEIAGRNKLPFKATKVGKKQDIIMQKNQDEAQFLMERATRNDFDCYMQVDPDTGEDTLYFIKKKEGRDGRGGRVYVFEWGKSLINFSPQLSLRDQVSKVTVRGWDVAGKKSFTYTASKSDLPSQSGGSGGLSGPAAAEERLQDKQDIVVDMPVTSAEEARDLAMSLLRERAVKFITGSGQVIGLPDLRPGDEVELKGLGKRFSATYEVRKVEHSIGSSGYRTQFEVQSPYDGGTK